MTDDVHATANCCWVTSVDVHGKEFRVRPKNECHVVSLTEAEADREAILIRSAWISAMVREALRLAEDVTAEDRAARIDQLRAAIDREDAAMEDYIAVAGIAKMTELLEEELT